MQTLITTMMLGLSLLAAVPEAAAFGKRGGHGFMGRHGGPGGPGGEERLPLRLLVQQMTPEQRRQVREIFMADRGARRDIMKQLRTAHEALGDKMLAAGTVGDADVAPLLDKIASLHRQLLDHGAKTMLQVRAIATPAQLAEAAKTKQRLDQLQGEIRTLLGKPSDDDDEGPSD
jgi:Spy/CpxP family protein refolding chaperone